ncbi:pseudouridine synthase [Sediminitomix flava]|nr:pseudouridine synthase [Sediminitomix flava]
MEQIEQEQKEILEILYQDEYYVVVNKPNGILVHRTELDTKAEIFVMTILRDQIGQYVYPVHRLDRPTSGVLIFALSPEACAALQEEFNEKRVSKKYWTIVRGYAPEEGTIDEPIKSRYQKHTKDAVSTFKKLDQVELPIPVGKFPCSRFSLMETEPITGRTHQLRLHFGKIRHYILGDTRYGDNKQNKMLEEQFQNKFLLLHCKKMSFIHPYTKETVTVSAALSENFHNVSKAMGLLENVTLPISSVLD